MTEHEIDMPTPLPEPESNPLCGADPLARALARLQPTPAGVDGQKLFFLAGQAARERTVTLWRRLFLGQCVLLVALSGGATLHFSRLDARDRTPDGAVRSTTIRPGPMPSPREQPPGLVEAADEPIPSSAPLPVLSTKAEAQPDDLADYLRLRREVLTAGLGLLPDTKPQPAVPVSPAELERSLFLPPGVLTAPYRVPEPKKPE